MLVLSGTNEKIKFQTDIWEELPQIEKELIKRGTMTDPASLIGSKKKDEFRSHG